MGGRERKEAVDFLCRGHGHRFIHASFSRYLLRSLPSFLPPRDCAPPSLSLTEADDFLELQWRVGGAIRVDETQVEGEIERERGREEGEEGSKRVFVYRLS